MRMRMYTMKTCKDENENVRDCTRWKYVRMRMRMYTDGNM